MDPPILVPAAKNSKQIKTPRNKLVYDSLLPLLIATHSRRGQEIEEQLIDPYLLY